MMLVENIVNNLYTYIADNDFNGFYDYLIEKLKYSTIEDCNLIVETFLNNLKYEKYYNMYSPVVKNTLEKELSSRQKNTFKEEDTPLDTPLINDLKIYLSNKDLQNFMESSIKLVNGAKDQNELSRIISSVGSLIQTFRKDKHFYERCYKTFRTVVLASPLHQGQMQELKEFIDSQKAQAIKK